MDVNLRVKMKIKFEWEQLNDDSSSSTTSVEVAYRAKVIGGWLVKTQILMDYQYGCNGTSDCEDSNHRHIDEEGYQSINENIIFISDPTHEWEIDKD